MLKFAITIKGTMPMLMHSSRLADPLDPATIELKKASSKRTKTGDDYEAVARAEFLGSLYIDGDIGPYIPGENVAASLLEGAKLNKLGVKVKRGLLVTTDVNPLSYKGPRDAAGLWEDKNFVHRASVKVSTSRVVRTRPIFRDWSTEVEGLLDESQLELRDLEQIAANAGDFIGLGDWRPRFGRFEATVRAIK
ncbi:hypothetical protein [Rhodococcus globerulus]|uniref:hypothetical protein n=1 Tax=Rhodococcus globerulus TaxID=33008 RepID=UPI0030162DCB